jgi:RND family efflux transporter MFP subunit
VLELVEGDVVRVVRGELRSTIVLSGSLGPMRQTVLSAAVDAPVAQVFVRPGEAVKAGQLLARFDTVELNNQVAARAAALEKSHASASLAEKNRNRSADLLARNFISANSVDTLDSNYAVAAAQMKADQVQLTIIRQSLHDTQIRAPFSGVIAERLVDPGERIAVNQKLFSIVDLSEFELVAALPTEQLRLVKVGQDVVVQADGFGSQRFPGKVERIAPVALSGSRMVSIYVRVKNPDGVLKAGMFAQGGVVVGVNPSATLLPLNALRGLDSAQPFVLVVTGGKVEKRPVTLGLVDQVSRVAAIASGVKEKDIIVIAKLESVKPGSAVKLLAPAASAS